MACSLDSYWWVCSFVRLPGYFPVEHPNVGCQSLSYFQNRGCDWPCEYEPKQNHQGTAGFSPWFHLPGFHFGCPFLTHSHAGSIKFAFDRPPPSPGQTEHEVGEGG